MRKLLFLSAFSFWMGGFVFYAAVVVPVGTKVLGSAVDQGFITREVTNYLNLSGLICLAMWAYELICQNAVAVGRRLRWSLWLVLAICLAALAALHPRLDALLDFDDRFVRDSRRFYSLHRAYLWIGTVQLLAALALLAGTIRCWEKRPTNR